MKKTVLASAFAVVAVAFFGCVSAPKISSIENANTKPTPMNGGTSWQPGDAMAPTTALFTTAATKVFENVAYASQSSVQVLDIYLPKGDGKFPVIALVHGGGFAFQNQKMKVVEPVAKYAVEQGYAVVSIDYRKSSEAIFPAALADVKGAIRFIRAHADEYGFDESKIAVWGESAGAYLSAMTALTSEAHELDGDVSDNAGVSSAVAALVDFYGPIEFYTMDTEFATLGKNGTSYSGENSFESKFLGKAIGSDKEAAYRTYWETYTASLPQDFALKAWIQAGTGDFAVPYTQSKNFSERLSFVIGKDNVHFGTIEGAKHMDGAFYTGENLSAVFAFLGDALK